MRVIKSLQSYLMVWCALVSGLTILIFSLFLYYFISGYFNKKADIFLIKLANIEGASALEIDSERNDANDEYPHIHGTSEESIIKTLKGINDRFVNIYSEKGKLLDRYSNRADFYLPTNYAAINSLGIGKLFFETLSSPFGPVRVLYLPFIHDGELEIIVQVGVSLSETNSILNSLRTALVFFNIFFFAVSILTSLFLSKKAVKPIKIIGNTASKIDKMNLEKRLEIDSPFREVNQLINLFNQMLQRIESAFVSQKDFIANASHEMQSPLTIIKGNIEVTLRKSRNVEDYVDILKSNLEEIDRISKLIKVLLTLARVDDEKLPLHLVSFSINNLVNDVLDIKRFEAEGKDINFEFPNSKSIYITGDSGLIYQLIYNLVDNAIEYTPISGCINIKCYSQNNQVCLEVKDNGEGISKGNLSKIFNRFYRVDLSRRRESGGCGLGLAIVKEIAKIHHGDISVDSVYGEWTKFTLKLPLKLDPL